MKFSHYELGGQKLTAGRRRHPLAAELIKNHDQTSWAMTKDGLICAPVGFYRVMDLYTGNPDESGEHVKTLVFGDDAEDLDLVPHPDNPKLKILKKPAYVLPPTEADFVKGWAEIEMRRHQGQWLDFALRFSNLYQTKKDDGEYFANNLASYRIYATPGEHDQKSYDVSFRINPFNRLDGLGLDQDKKATVSDRILRRGVVLKTGLPNSHEAKAFIHDDFRERYLSFLKGEEVQRWKDPHKVQLAAMWFNNRLGDMRGHPLTIGSALTTFLELAVTKFKPAGVIFELGKEALDDGAQEEKHPNSFQEIAEVSENSAAPISSMKEGTRERLVAATPKNTQASLIKDFPLCKDVATHQRLRTLDIVHGLEPALIGADKDGAAVSARAYYGLEVHRLNSRVYITYSPGPITRTLPRRFKPFFRKGYIAEIDILAANQNASSGQNQTFELPFAPPSQAHITFRNVAEALTLTKDSPRVANAVRFHQYPRFTKIHKATIEDAPETRSIQKRFKDCARALVHYGRLVSPFVDAKNPRDLSLSILALGVGIGASADVFGRIVEVGAPWAFAFSAALLTRRLATNGRNEKEQKNLNVVTQGLFALGPALFAKRLVPDMWNDISHGKVEFNDELFGDVGGLLTAAALCRTHLKKFGKAFGAARALFRKLPTPV